MEAVEETETGEYEEQEEVDNISDNIRSPAKRRAQARLTHGHGFLSKSVANLSSSLNLSSSEGMSPCLSRSDSISSLGSSCTVSSGAVITAAEIRSLTNNYQRLLKQATKEIKKLNVEKWKVEQEQDKLLTTNLELAEEVRRMMENDKEWRAERQTLLNVNEEFATEVERLYKNEERYQNEKEKLESQLKDSERRYESERQNQSSHLHDEQSKLESQIKKLTQSLGTMKEEYQQLLDTNKRKENQLSSKQENIMTSQERDLSRLQGSLKEVREDLESERRLVAAGEAQIKMLKAELRRTEEEIRDIRQSQETEGRGSNADMGKLREQNEKISAENFEYAVENNELKKKLFQTQDREKQLKRELSGLKTEHQWVLNNQKASNQSKKSDESGKIVEALHNELKQEKEKVKNLAEWKSQLSDKNKELKQENEKLVNKVEDLERLMNDEVTDINEILNVINTIQIDKNIPELKSENQRFF